MAATYFGYNVALAAFKVSAAGYLDAMRFQNTAGSGTLTEIGLYFTDMDSTGNVRLGIYADTGSATQPGALLLDAGAVAFSEADTWYSKTGLSLSVTNGTYYWLAWIPSVAAYLGGEDNAGSSRSMKDAVGYGALPTPFPTIAGNYEERICVRAGVEVAGGDVSLPLTGVSGTASVGTLALSAALALTGLVGTAAVGTLAPTPSVPIAGISAPTSLGSVSPAMAAVLSGIEAVDAAGTMVPSNAIVVSISGNAATGAVGTVSRGATDLPISGNEATAAVGDQSPGSSPPLTGNAATGAVGDVTAHIGIGPDITIPITGVAAGPAYPLSGVAAAAGVGTVSPNIEYVDIILPITGVGATSAVGNIAWLEFGGWAATGEVGSVTPNVSPPLTGTEATPAVGNLGVNRTVGLTGASGTGAAGGWSGFSRPLTGVEATGGVGTLSPRISVALDTSWMSTVAYIGAHGWYFNVERSSALAGTPATGAAGFVGTFIAGDVVRPITGVVAATAVGTLTCLTATPSYIDVKPRRRILDVSPRRRILDIHRRRH